MDEVSAQFQLRGIINEIGNTAEFTPVVSKTTHYAAEYALKYTIKDIVYIFSAKNYNGDWSIAWEREDHPGKFEPINTNEYSGEALTGLLKCITVLIHEKNIKSFVFNSYDQRLKRFYSKFIQYFERETGFKLQNILDLPHGGVSWRYVK